MKIQGNATTTAVSESIPTKLLPFVLSFVAGSVDTIGFFGLVGLFTAHVTGNLVILAAAIAAGHRAPVAQLLAVPVFMVAVALARIIANAFEHFRISAVIPLLVLQFFLLDGFLTVAYSAGPQPDPASASLIFAGMLGVAAMAMQNALVRISLTGIPSTAVMTINVTTFSIDLVQIWYARTSANARERLQRTWPALVGFLLGCAFGAAGEARFGLVSLLLPAAFALIALLLAISNWIARA